MCELLKPVSVEKLLIKLYGSAFISTTNEITKSTERRNSAYSEKTDDTENAAQIKQIKRCFFMTYIADVTVTPLNMHRSIPRISVVSGMDTADITEIKSADFVITV